MFMVCAKNDKMNAIQVLGVKVRGKTRLFGKSYVDLFGG